VAESLLELDDIAVSYGDIVALKIPRLKVGAGEVLALLGPNGAGKTTLLKVMGLLQAPSTGSLRFQGLLASPGNAFAIRRRIATVFQEALLLNDTVYQNAALGLKLRGVSRGEIADRLGPWLDRLGIAHLAGRSARTLSGGEAQRTSLARALALRPELLLLDEPFAALDPVSREELLRDFQRIVKEARVTTVFVTHDRGEAFALADQVGVMADGRVLQLGTREEVFRRPASPVAAQIVGVENCLAGIVQDADSVCSTIAIGATTVFLPMDLPRGVRVVACVRAEDIELGQTNGRLREGVLLRGKVINISPGLPRYRVALDCNGFGLVAMVERTEAAAIALGDEVAARFSADAVHVIGGEKDC
jgi:tungstate transport system ATP-binding protein